ncbi:helix-turn-helix domain-containing protein [Fulvimarina endophytica]|uniref:Helix-turn-helix domain-containing protein n=1 Tax=Fulvimarina endophytica TaxID=2293836 RepID=A0A371X737_9HYPH|nr:helix-turn-helix domain-containing protein [Fulvimarina endophytica]RFC65001.1 helix-turn-helix domain-containing protein [Fulvimarina endophytica]
MESVEQPAVEVSRFTTEDVTGEEKFALWQSSISVIFDVERDERQASSPFEARLESAHIGTSLIGRCVAGSQIFRRSPKKIIEDGADHLMLQFFDRGGSEAMGGGMKARAGDILILDLAEPIENVNADFANYSLVLPRSAFEADIARLDEQHMRVVAGDQPLAEFFRGAVQSVHAMRHRMSIEDAQTMGATVAQLGKSLITSLSGHSEAPRHLRRQSALFAIRRYIDDRLMDPSLGPDQIMAAFDISRSSLYALFEPLGGVRTYVRQRRLQRSLRDLLSTQTGKVRISEIGWKWGFSSESDYSRAFRRQFGFSPRDAREAFRTSSGSAASTGVYGDRDYEKWLRSIA